MPKIEIYTKDYCGYCALAKAILREQGFAYEEHDVSDDPELFKAMVDRAEGRLTVPQVFIDGVAIGGADELAQMQERGLLAFETAASG